MIQRRQALRSLAMLAVAARAQAAPGGLPSAAHEDSSPEWEKLQAQLFPQRRPVQGQARVQLFVPLRAAYGASVPVKVVAQLPQRPELAVKRLMLFVDQNPSPLAATIDFTVDAGQADLETRLRVDTYSHVRVVAELTNGELHTDSRFVKTSGGCSAPPNLDHPELIGKTILKLPQGLNMNAPTVADVTVIHPNDTGFELNQVTVMTIPSHFVRTIAVSYADRKIFDADLDFSLSENPTLRFNFVPHAPGELRAEVTDSKEGHFVGRLEITA